MATVVSANNPHVLLLDELQDFQAQALKLVREGRRRICVLSATLDAPLYNTDEFCEAVRLFVTQSRYTDARFLVKDTSSIIKHGHRLAELAQRLAGKLQLRKLTEAPQNTRHGWLIVDNARLLYKHDEDAWNGYADYVAASKCTLLLEEFTNLWELYGEEDPYLRQQLL